jgi:hypothetical protein
MKTQGFHQFIRIIRPAYDGSSKKSGELQGSQADF